jgi:acetyl-CoA carboxylase biotin carboxyl carrier protein
MALTDDDVREILRIIDESDLEELTVETAGFRLHVSKHDGPAPSSTSPPAGSDAPAAIGAPAAADAPVADAPADADTVAIESPMLGTFYRAEAPGAGPFVDVGGEVAPDTTVCIIEVMKMMNSVPAGISGEIVEVCAENGELVEFGEPLFRVKPAE